MTMAQDGTKQTKPAPSRPKQTKPATSGPAVRLEVPIGPLPTGYIGRHVEVGYMSHQQGEALARLLAGLHGRPLASGRLVQSGADVIRWLLDRVAEGTA